MGDFVGINVTNSPLATVNFIDLLNWVRCCAHAMVRTESAVRADAVGDKADVGLRHSAALEKCGNGGRNIPFTGTGGRDDWACAKLSPLGRRRRMDAVVHQEAR